MLLEYKVGTASSFIMEVKTPWFWIYNNKNQLLTDLVTRIQVRIKSSSVSKKFSHVIKVLIYYNTSVVKALITAREFNFNQEQEQKF